MASKNGNGTNKLEETWDEITPKTRPEDEAIALREPGDTVLGVYLGSVIVRRDNRNRTVHVFTRPDTGDFMLWGAALMDRALDEAVLGRVTQVTRMGGVSDSGAVEYSVRQRGPVIPGAPIVGRGATRITKDAEPKGLAAFAGDLGDIAF